MNKALLNSQLVSGTDIQIRVDALQNLPAFAVDGKPCTRDDSDPMAGQAAFTCPDLDRGIHELDIQNDQDLPIFICHLDLGLGATTSAVGSATTASPTTSESSMPVLTLSYSYKSQFYAPTPPASGTSSSNPIQAVHAGEIAIGIVAGVLLVIIVGFSGYLLRLRRRHQGHQGKTSLLTFSAVLISH